MEARSVYLICQEEFLSALSYGPVRSTLHPPPPRALPLPLSHTQLPTTDQRTPRRSRGGDGTSSAAWAR